MQNINWLYICFYKDLGQKDFGHVTCPTCGMVYTKAQPDDEAEHIRHHKRFVSGLRFTVSTVQQLDKIFHNSTLESPHFWTVEKLQYTL